MEPTTPVIPGCPDAEIVFCGEGSCTHTPPHLPLPALRVGGSEDPHLLTRWALTPHERTRIVLGDDLYLWIQGERPPGVMPEAGLQPATLSQMIAPENRPPTMTATVSEGTTLGHTLPWNGEDVPVIEIAAAINRIKFREFRQRERVDMAFNTEPVHQFFGLSYANFLVIPRSRLQSAPIEWQRRFVALMHDLNAMIPDPISNTEAADYYHVAARKGARFVGIDFVPPYDRGRTRMPIVDDEYARLVAAEYLTAEDITP